ncbi:androgen-dependent TFPI-regulating protein-like [Choristoneura fumiferana]|uniref:androgen-dependent TFPI-regulating protein-like n=1 Tax=Choristoneura fumiferana TaxID=7141 RepID=UPI003D156B09
MAVILYLRMLGYAVTIIMHLSNCVCLGEAMKGPASEDPDIKAFGALQLRFFTTWTFIVQIFHAVMGLICDYLTLKNANRAGYKLPMLLKGTKDAIFAAILWPTVFLVFTMFWSLYSYDRSLIYPLFADKILTRTSNHICHTAIVPVVVWEAVFQPRSVPRSHSKNIFMLAVYMLTYLNIMSYTYLETGIWMYPVFGLAHKTLLFPLIIIIIGVALVTYYHMQWYLTRLVWGARVKNKTY